MQITYYQKLLKNKKEKAKLTYFIFTSDHATNLGGIKIVMGMED